MYGVKELLAEPRTAAMVREGILPSNNGRDKVPWDSETWDRIDQAVHAECYRTKIAAKFLPMYGPIDPKARTVPSDRVEVLEAAALTARAPGLRAAQAGPIPLLDVDEAAETPIVEIQVQFQMTPQQVHDEAETDDRGYARNTSGQSSFAGRGSVDFSRSRSTAKSALCAK